MRRKSYLAMICVVLLAFVVAACSGNNNKPSASESAGSSKSNDGGSTATADSSPQAQGPDTSPLTFDLYVNFSWYALNWKDPVAKAITDKTGVTLNISKPVSDDEQQINIMIANKDLPDLFLSDKGSPALQKMVEGDMLYSLDELIDQYAPEMKEFLPKEALTNYKHKDGKTYYLVSYIEGEQFKEAALKYNSLIGSNQPTWSIRQDYLDEIGNPDISNPDAFIAALEQIKAKYPKKIGFYTNANGIQNASQLSKLGLALGTGNYLGANALYEEGNEIKSGLRSPEFIEVIKFLNKLSTKGLLTKDSYIDSKEIFTQKVNNGDAVSYVWTIGDGTKVPADNSNTAYKVMAPFDTYKQIRSGSGWTAVAIPKANKNPQRAIELLSFLASEEGHKVVKWGVEGTEYKNAAEGPHYQVVDGKPTYLPEYWAEKQADWSGVAEKNGLSEYWLAANSTWWNMPEWDANDPQFTEYNKMFGQYVEYKPQYDKVHLDPASDEGIIEKKIIDTFVDYYAKIIFAKDEATALSLYDEFMAKAENLGLSKVEQAWNAKLQ